MDLTQHLSDDQTALIGCALALLASGGLMWVSYFVGQALRRQSRAENATPSVRIFRELRPDPSAARPGRKAA